MKKSKLAWLFLSALLLLHCGESIITVPLAVAPQTGLQFSSVQKLWYIDFLVDFPDTALDPLPPLKKFFTAELAPYVGKSVSDLPVPHWDMIRRLLKQLNLIAPFQYDNNMFFKQVFDAHPDDAFFTGKLFAEIKERSVIRDVKDGSGKKTSQFVKLVYWDLRVQIFVIDGRRHEVVFEKTYSEKMEAEDPSVSSVYLSLLDKIKDRFIFQVSQPERMQERYILKK